MWEKLTKAMFQERWLDQKLMDHLVGQLTQAEESVEVEENEVLGVGDGSR